MNELFQNDFEFIQTSKSKVTQLSGGFPNENSWVEANF